MFRSISIIIILLIALGGCRTTQMSTSIHEKKDSIIYREKTIVKDSIITVVLPRDTVIINRIVKQNKITHIIKDIDTIMVERGIVGAKAWLVKNRLGVIAYVSDSTLFYKLNAAKKIINRYKELYSKEKIKNTSTKIKYKNTGFARFTIWWFIISVFLIFLLFVLKFKGLL